MNLNKVVFVALAALGMLVVFGITSLVKRSVKPETPVPPAVVDQNLLYLAHAGMVLNREFDYVVRIATNQDGNFQLVWRPAMCSPTSEWQVHPMVMTNYGQAWSAKLVSQRDLLAKFLTNGFK